MVRAWTYKSPFFSQFLKLQAQGKKHFESQGFFIWTIESMIDDVCTYRGKWSRRQSCRWTWWMAFSSSATPWTSSLGFLTTFFYCNTATLFIYRVGIFEWYFSRGFWAYTRVWVRFFTLIFRSTKRCPWKDLSFLVSRRIFCQDFWSQGRVCFFLNPQ